MIHLITLNILRYNSCITMDQEFALNSSIKTTMDSANVSFAHSKLRLDYYHFFRKIWTELVRVSCRKITIALFTIRRMERWILSWFKYVESEKKLNVSIKYFDKFLEENHS